MPFQIVDDREQNDREFSSAFVYLNEGVQEPEIPEEWDYEHEPEETFDAEYFEQRRGSLIGVTPSRFVEFAIMLPDKESNTYKPFDFSQRRYLRQIYDTPSIRTLLKCGRQVEKSTLLGNKLLSYSCINSAMNCLYVSPTNLQTKTFSNDRLKEPIETSHYLKSWTTSKLSDSISLKKFINRSQITLRYAFLNADRCRGIPADVICLDEIQDLLTDNIGVIEECASHSVLNISGRLHKGGIFMYSGTPKSLDNTLEFLWTNQSTQNEWIVPCHRHSIKTGDTMSKVYWNILDEDNIGLKAVVCDRCHKPLDVADPMAAWASMNPGILKSDKIKKPFEGFRIPQLMVPWIEHSNIIQKQATYSRATFYNEVLGLSYDAGTRPLTQQDVIDNCDARLLLTPEYQNSLKRYLGSALPVYGGIDWGCYSEDTRTLTEHGFKYHWEIDETKDRIAQYDPRTGEISYVLARKKIVFDHDGEMIHFKTNGQDLLVTPDHKIMYRTGSRSNSPWKEGEAQEVVGLDNVRFPEEGFWIGDYQEWFSVAGQQVSSEIWLKFLGFVISEGCIYESKKGYKGIALYQRDGNAVDQIQEVLDALPFPHRHRYNARTKDHIWDICGPDKIILWTWMRENIGSKANTKRIPRHLLALSKDLLGNLFESLMLGDGTWDKRDSSRGAYSTTSEGLADDFLELAYKLGYRAKKSLHKKTVGNRKTQWRVSISGRREAVFHSRTGGISRVPYNGKAYCFSVPSGYFVTERNGCIAQSGNTGENTYTVVALGAYMGDGRFNIFYIHRYEGREAEPQVQIEEISRLINKFQVQLVGCDYGGGFWPNDELTRRFGFQRVPRYQYSTPSTKVKWDQGLNRFLVHRTEVMSDIFNAIKRRDVFRFPNWDQFRTPFGTDMLSIFSEYNEQIRQNVYKKSPNNTDDAFHAILLCFLASMIRHPRPDVIAPNASYGRPQKKEKEEI